MRYAIVANPASGKTSLNQKCTALAKAAEVLDAKVHGLDTDSSDDFIQCARELVAHCDVLVVAGGDGTLSDIINSIDTAVIPIAYLPLGTGNAMRHALQYKGDLGDIAVRIKEGRIHAYDLIHCDKRIRAFSVSMGLDGTVIRRLGKYRTRHDKGFITYVRLVTAAYFKEYTRTTATLTLDDKMIEVDNLLSLMVVKHPYYGFGMNVVPRARFNDGRLHISILNSGLLKSVIGGLTAFTIGNRAGSYRTGRQLKAEFERPVAMQIDGNQGWTAGEFRFAVIQNALRIKC